MAFFKKNKKTPLFKVTYHEIDTTNYETAILDEKSLYGLWIDWAFVIDEIIPLE